MANVTAAKMITVKDKPFSNKLPLKAIERLTKNKVSDQPDRLVFPVIQNMMDNKTQKAARL